MKILSWILLGFCILLACWCNLNTYFIDRHTERIEKLEKTIFINKVDTVFIKFY